MAASVSPPATISHDRSVPTGVRPRFRGLGRILLFFGLVTALAFGLQALITFGLRRIPTSKFGSLNKVLEGQVNAAIIVNGSSRALTHYDPRVIQQATGLSAYNLGLNGVQIDVQLAMLKTYLSQNKRPQLVIQNLESFTFEPTKAGELYDVAAYVPYLSNPELYRGLLAIDPAAWKWKNIPLYGYAVEDLRFTWAWGLLSWVGVHGREDYFQGFNPRHMSWTGDFERYQATVGDPGVTYRIEPRGVAALDEMARLCAEKGIALILVYSPVYHEMQSIERNRTEVFATFESIRKKYGLVLWDYSDSPLCQRRENFYNSQHLNAGGAALFSADIGRRLSAAGYRSTHTTSGGN